MEVQSLANKANNNVPLRTETKPTGSGKQGKQLEALGSGNNKAEAASKPDKTVKMEQLKKAVEDANNAARSANRQLNFSIDSTTDRIVVRVINEASGEVIRQIPSKEMLDIAAHLAEAAKKGEASNNRPVILSKRF